MNNELIVQLQEAVYRLNIEGHRHQADAVKQAIAALSATPRQIKELEAIVPRPLADYHEDFGPVTWWKLPVDEPAWIGRPDDSDWPGYHTHFTPHPPLPAPPTSAEQEGEPDLVPVLGDHYEIFAAVAAAQVGFHYAGPFPVIDNITCHTQFNLTEDKTHD